jgi:ABC-2 type transport system permease protein
MRLLRAETVKLATVAANLWLLLGTAGGMVALGATVTATVHIDQCTSPAECFEDTTRLGLSGVHLGQILVIVLAVLCVSGEHDTGMIRTTFAAAPRRLRVFAAKAAVVTGAALAAGALAVAGSIALARPILRHNGFAHLPAPAEGPSLRAAVGTVLYLGLIAVLSLGLAALVRDTAVAITAAVGLLYLFPIVSQFVDSDLIRTYGPLSAGLAVQATVGLDHARIGPWAGLAVLAGWAATFALAGAARFVLSDP